MTDEQLLSDYAVAGSEESFAELVRRHSERLRAIAMRFGCNPELARDAAQEVWLIVHLKCREFRGESSFSTWIYRIAKHASLNITRLKKNRMPIASEFQLSCAKDDCRESLQCMVDDERRRDLTNAIAKLPRIYRDVIQLSDLDEKRYEWIARELKIPLGTVKSRRHKGIAILQKELAA